MNASFIKIIINFKIKSFLNFVNMYKIDDDKT